MTTIAREVWIDAPRDRVWEILADFGNVYLVNPIVTRSYLTSDQTHGVGTTRHCDLARMGARLEERIVGWEEGKSMRIQVYDWEKMPGIRSMEADLTLHDERGGTRLAGEVTYTLGLGPVGGLLDATMMRAQNTKGWELFLAGIKHYAETGRPVEETVRLDRSDVAAA